jgi:hypothetical protein
MKMANRVVQRLECQCLVLAAWLLTSGCATIAHGRTQGIRVLSAPAGATVSVKGESVGVTPARVVLNRSESDVVLRLEKEGYGAVDVPLKSTLSGWTGANLPLGLFGGATGGNLGMIGAVAFYGGIDLITGAAYSFEPNAVHVVLEVAGAVAPESDERREGSAQATGGEPRLFQGSRVRVSAPAIAARRIVGTLTAFDDDSLTLEEKGRRDPLIIPRAAITKLDVSSGPRSRALLGAGLGLAGSLVAGLATGAKCPGGTTGSCGTALGTALMYSLALAPLGAMIGGDHPGDRWEDAGWKHPHVGVSLVPGRGLGVSVTASVKWTASRK